MALKTTVKISSVNNLSDARYCAGMTVDLMGFDLNPKSNNYINYQNFIELTGWISGIKLVGEFAISNSIEEIKHAIKEYELEYIQLSNPELVNELKDDVKHILFHFDVDNISKAEEVANIMEQLKDHVSYFIFESSKDAQYKPHVQNEVLKLAESYPVIMGFNIDQNTIDSLLNTSNIKGIALKGGEEIRPGYKDFDELADILEHLEIED